MVLIHKAHVNLPAAPVQCLLMGIKVEVEPLFALDGRAAIFHDAVAVARNVKAGAKGIEAGIGRNGSVLRLEKPGKEENSDRDHPGVNEAVPGKQTRRRFVRFGAAGRKSCIAFTLMLAGADITVPEIEFEIP